MLKELFCSIVYSNLFFMLQGKYYIFKNNDVYFEL
jgi:hypothetical protein